MTVICPADSSRFSESDWLDLNVWLAISPTTTCPCCGELLVRLEDGRVQVTGAIGLAYATRLANEIGRFVNRPVAVVVRAGR